ncbi:unnamed protein product [Phytophthora lilii]|uniref:Unnamed protein product n=1 Tax=Phytophthora lilii TaxID=2077276 RepID=A0A9W6YJ33_9STRA|nr:unnamed protein product [Phytophthora lilii]
MAIAYEAFDFVELEDGDKMTFTMFLKWCVFHPRPKALLEKISCLFSVCDAVKKMKLALEQRQERLVGGTFLHYNDMHFGSLDESAEHVEATRANVLIEVDTQATVKLFAFVLPQEDAEARMDGTVPTQELVLQAFQPALFKLSGLAPDTTYVLRFLGIRRTDRDRCVAMVSTKSRIPSLGIEHNVRQPVDWRIRILNHCSQDSKRLRPQSSLDAEVHQNIRRDGYHTLKPLLTIHSGFALSPQKVFTMLKILEQAIESAEDNNVAEERVVEMIKQGYRSVLSDPDIWSLLRCHSNWFFDSNESVLYSDLPCWRAQRRKDTKAKRYLIQLSLAVWQAYIGCLWGIEQNDPRCLAVDDGVMIAPITTQFDLGVEDEVEAFIKEVLSTFNEFSATSTVLLVTTTPIFCRSRSTDVQWRIAQDIIGWNLADLKRQVIFVSFDDTKGYHSIVGIRNTTLSLSQLVCGPLVGVAASSTAGLHVQARPQTNPTDQLIVRHGALDRRPHYVEIASSTSGQELTGGRRSSGVADVPYVQLHVQLVPLQTLRDVNRIGLVNGGSGTLQTLHEDLPAFRLAILSDDRFLDGKISVAASDGTVPPPPSFIENVASHFMPLVGTLQVNFTVHLGCVVSLAHELQRMYTLHAQNQEHFSLKHLQNSIRFCVRQHWNAPRNQELLARGTHWFPSVGILRAILTVEDIPVSFLKMVKQVLAEYEKVGDIRSHSDLPSERYLYRLQNRVAVLMIDTLEAILESDNLTPFVQLPELLLSESQWQALEFWLQGEYSQGVEENQRPNTVVIMCDIPLVSQRGGSSHTTQTWCQRPRVVDDEPKSRRCKYLSNLGTTSWNSYPNEQVRLLRLIFDKLRKEPRFHVVFVCSGAFSSRMTITESSSKAYFQQVVVGPISKPASSPWTDQGPTTSPVVGDKRLARFYSIRHEIPVGAIKAQQYCALELMPHPFGASSATKFYVQGHGEAKLILGPIIGRVTPRTARILIELDRPVPSLTCILTDPATSQSNSMLEFLPSQSTNSTSPRLRSQWPRILTNGMTSFAAQLAGHASYAKNDSLGDQDAEGQQNFNPWHSIEDEYLSEPLSSPQLLIHLGGQVDMGKAFTNEELASLVDRFSRQVESSTHDEDSKEFQQLRSEVRYRMQEVYRIAWGVPPMKRVLRYCSNLMLLNEDLDLYFSHNILRAVLNKSHLKNVSDTTLTSVAAFLRGLAFELWQLYQNQLWTDLAERELKYGTKSSGNKAAFVATFGINRMVVANVSHEVYEYTRSVVETQLKAQAYAVRPLDEQSSLPSVSMFSAASWKVIEEALENSISETSQTRVAPTRPKNPIQQLVLVISGDLMMWGGSKTFPALRSDIVKLFEKIFAWKCIDRIRREVAVICYRTEGSSITFEVTDEKLSERLTLTCIGSISSARELLHRDQKKAKVAVATLVKGAAISKGHFSKRFSYRSITNTASTKLQASELKHSVTGSMKHSKVNTDADARTATRCRTYASYRFVTDYRRGFFDETLRFFPPQVSLPKAIVGPVIGRMALKEAPRAEPEEPLGEGDPGDRVKMCFSVPILLEINADARVVCVVTDILANQDACVVKTMIRYHPQVFEISSLLPERRYVYRFEGISNSESRRGSFHTPSSSLTSLNFVAVSSNFPEQMEESTDSLWAAIRKRVQVSWCGLDMVLHLGGQVPMHEAAFECFEWARRELNHQRESVNENATGTLIMSLRRKIRQRLQQRYHLCWNIPNVRETLAHTSNWFLRSQADIAPFFRNHDILYTKAAQLVLSEATQVVADYQISLMQQNVGDVGDTALELPSPESGLNSSKTPEAPQLPIPDDLNINPASTNNEGKNADAIEPEAKNQDHKEKESCVDSGGERIDTAQFIQTGEIGIFMCDMRSTPRDDVVTCNNRLVTPLTHQEHAIIGEKQWQQFEKALKKKAVMLFVLCMELPLILTDAKYVDNMREDLDFSHADPGQEEALGRWKLYDRHSISQQWVSCRRQLEQLLNLLFRWKAKYRGREVIVLSGGMRVGLETLLQDRETKLSFRSFTVGPLTARVEQDFDNMPLAGTACPTFLGGAVQRDERFTFAHSVVNNKNYLLTHSTITREQSDNGTKVDEEIRSASIETEFIAEDGQVDATHPVNLYQRFPTWWKNYVPMGKIVFWDDTVMMRAHSDEGMTALVEYLQDGREFTAALEVLFEKHQFAEAARMEELRSKHRRRQQGPEELRASLRGVFDELWKVISDTHRQRVSYFRDEFVFDFLLGYIAPALFEDTNTLEGNLERPPLEFAAFSALCRDFIFNAGVLNLSLSMQQEDELRIIAKDRADACRRAAEQEAQRLQQEQQRREDEAELARLQQEDPEAYAKRKLAEQEAAQQEKLAKAEAAREQRKAEKLRDVEEELATAKEQRKLDKLAENGNDPHEFTRRRELLAARIRRFEERKRHRETEEARRREKKEKKRRDKAAQQKDG